MDGCSNCNCKKQPKPFDPGMDVETRKNWLDAGKEEINKMLWSFLPGNVTLAEADNIAIKIFYLIEEAWK